MKRLLKFKDEIYNTIGLQKYDSDKMYKISPYLIIEKIDENILMYNLLTYEMLQLTNEDLEINKKFLIKHWFFIDENVEPYSMCSTFKKIYRQLYKRKTFGKITDYTILTTTNCNARCSYCYEKGCKKYDMAHQTAMDIGAWINKTSYNNIKMHWFGGEPLYNGDAITTICQYLTGKNKLYSSSMISNGYLFHKYPLDIIKKVWKLENVQITLDGTKNNYNMIKNYVNASSNPFDQVIDNIEYLLSNQIRVSIRLNLSKWNIDDMYKLIDYLKNKFSGYNNLTLYSHPLFNDEQKADTLDYINIQKYLKENYIANFRDLTSFHLFNQCFADNMHSVVINPIGKLTLCEHYSDEEIIGDIYSDTLDIDKIMDWQEIYEISMCKTCSLFPQCAKIKKCPVGECTDDWRNNLEFQIRESMKNVYRRLN